MDQGKSTITRCLLSRSRIIHPFTRSTAATFIVQISSPVDSKVLHEVAAWYARDLPDYTLLGRNDDYIIPISRDSEIVL